MSHRVKSYRFNQNIPENLDSQENQCQERSQSNLQININPQKMFPQPENQSAEKSNNESQEKNDSYQKQLDSQQNQLSPKVENDYPSPRNTNKPQSDYPPTQEDIDAAPKIIVQNDNYPQSNEQNNQEQPIYNNAYPNITNIKQIHHKGISQIDEKTFYISTGCCIKLLPWIASAFGLLFTFIILFFAKSLAGLFGLIFFFVGIFICYKMYNSVYFILGPNTLTVTKIALCRKRSTIYNPGDLRKVEFKHNFSPDRDGNYLHNYALFVVEANKNINNIFYFGSSFQVFTNEEINYFLYHINTHIQTKMTI